MPPILAHTPHPKHTGFRSHPLQRCMVTLGLLFHCEFLKAFWKHFQPVVTGVPQMDSSGTALIEQEMGEKKEKREKPSQPAETMAMAMAMLDTPRHTLKLCVL